MRLSAGLAVRAAGDRGRALQRPEGVCQSGAIERPVERAAEAGVEQEESRPGPTVLQQVADRRLCVKVGRAQRHRPVLRGKTVAAEIKHETVFGVHPCRRLQATGPAAGNRTGMHSASASPARFVGATGGSRCRGPSAGDIRPPAPAYVAPAPTTYRAPMYYTAPRPQLGRCR